MARTPAQWAEPPSRPNTAPVVAPSAEIRSLIDAAERSRRPEYAGAILVAATTGLRRAEWCGLRRRRDLDLDGGMLTVSSTVVALPQAAVEEIPTKNRRVRSIALDDLTAQLDALEARARGVKVELVDDAFVFSDVLDGSVPWKPDRVTLYFSPLRDRAGLGHVKPHSLRKFMETYGQEMGYSMTQVALRAGHNPAVAARYYSGKVAETDRELAPAVAGLLTPATLPDAAEPVVSPKLEVWR